MKKVIFCLIISLLIGGCGDLGSKAWYNPKKSIVQAKRDYEDCYFISPPKGIFDGFNDNAFSQCLHTKGYRLVDKAYLRKDNRIIIKISPIQVDSLGLISRGRQVAGRKSER